MSESTAGIKINFAYFKEVADGCQEAYTDLLQLILKQQAESFETLRTTCENRDFNLLEITAHKMKAIVAIMGLTEQRQQLGELEEAARMQVTQAYLAKRIQELDLKWKVVAQELQNELAVALGN